MTKFKKMQRWQTNSILGLERLCVVNTKRFLLCDDKTKHKKNGCKQCIFTCKSRVKAYLDTIISMMESWHGKGKAKKKLTS